MGMFKKNKYTYHLLGANEDLSKIKSPQELINFMIDYNFRLLDEGQQITAVLVKEEVKGNRQEILYAQKLELPEQMPESYFDELLYPFYSKKVIAFDANLLNYQVSKEKVQAPVTDEVGKLEEEMSQRETEFSKEKEDIFIPNTSESPLDEHEMSSLSGSESNVSQVISSGEESEPILSEETQGELSELKEKIATLEKEKSELKEQLSKPMLNDPPVLQAVPLAVSPERNENLNQFLDVFQENFQANLNNYLKDDGKLVQEAEIQVEAEKVIAIRQEKERHGAALEQINFMYADKKQERIAEAQQEQLTKTEQMKQEIEIVLKSEISQIIGSLKIQPQNLESQKEETAYGRQTSLG